MSLKCVVCDEPAEYMYMGFSFCKEHLQKKKKQQQDVQKKIEKMTGDLKLEEPQVHELDPERIRWEERKVTMEQGV